MRVGIWQGRYESSDARMAVYGTNAHPGVSCAFPCGFFAQYLAFLHGLVHGEIVTEAHDGNGDERQRDNAEFDLDKDH